MTFSRILTPLAAAVAMAGALAPTAQAAVPAQFTTRGEAVSFQDGKATHVPNTLYYRHGAIRLEMASPVNADGATAFSVVLAQEGGATIVLLNPTEKQAMKLDASSLEAVTENPSLQKISTFKLSEFGQTFRARSKKIGAERVAGEATTVFEQTGKQGHFRLWLSDRYDIPLRFTYFEGGKPAFTYEAKQLALTVALPAASFSVPVGYELTDLSAIVNDGAKAHHR